VNVLTLFLLFPRVMFKLLALVLILGVAAVVWGMAASEGGNVNCMQTPSAQSCQAMGVR
jgi:hypothetical protein